MSAAEQESRVRPSRLELMEKHKGDIRPPNADLPILKHGSPEWLAAAYEMEGFAPEDVEEDEDDSAAPENDNRPRIDYSDHAGTMNDRIVQALAKSAANVRIFRRGPQLATPYTVNDVGFKGREVEVLQFQPWSAENFGVELNRHFDVGFARKDKQGRQRWVRVNPLTSVKLRGAIRALLKTPKDWGDLPAIARLSSVPIYLGGGRMLATNGYHPELGGVFLHMDGTINVPRSPTRGDAERALAVLEEVLAEFPFDNEDGTLAHDTALAALMTGALRSSLELSPGIAIDGNCPGVGKSTLADAINILHTGKRTAVSTWSPNHEENRKVIDAAMIGGRQTITFDNVHEQGEIYHEALAQLLTQHEREARVLGQSRNMTLPCTQLVMATGNGLRIVRDCTRRFIYVRLVANMENPHTRRFSNVDFFEWLGERRHEVLSACLTITAAFERSGENVVAASFAGYDQWTRWVRDPLVWLGKRDASKTVELMRDEDEDTTSFVNVLEAWGGAYGEQPALLKDVAKASQHTDLQNALRDALDLPSTHPIDTRALGDYLRARKQRIVAGLSLAPVAAGNKASKAKAARPWVLQAHGRPLPTAPEGGRARKF